jgi:hypothetical protein
MPLINYIASRQESLVNNAGGFIRGGAPIPPPLTIDFLVVGGGMVRGAGIGGCAGGVVSGSAVTMSFNTTLDIEVGLGGSGSNNPGFSSSISASSFGFYGAGGAGGNTSGTPQSNPEGTSGPDANGNGGGGGSSQAGFNGTVGASGRGGDGSIWLDGNYYAGGGGGLGSSQYTNGPGGLGGGGYGAPGACIVGCPPGENGVDGTGGGGGGNMQKGGSGIVIIRYLTSSLVPPYDNSLSGGSLSITGSYAYRTFTGSAQLTYRF